jgi:hypothetical protein
MWKFAATISLSLSVIAVAGCGDTTTNTSMDMTAAVIPHNFDQINTQIFQTGCANFSVCHNAKVSTQGNLDLKADPYAALVGVLANNAKANGEGKLRVKPCDSANSFLIIKLKLPMNLDPNTDYGHYMPDTNPHLPNEQIQAISDWIDRGALKNEPATVTGKTCMLANDMASSHD